jgi:hypothetical protein
MPILAVALGALGMLTALVFWRPSAAAVLVIGLTPLLVGIDRGRLLPLLRPNEALVLVLAAVLLTRFVVLLRPGQRIQLNLTGLEWLMVAMATCNSALPLLAMALRGRTVTPDDLSYALVLWKYLAVYALVRASVRTDRAVAACLWAAVVAATLAAGIGILQALDLAGVRAVLAELFAPHGYAGALAIPRGGSTLSLPAAAADLYVMSLAVILGLWWRARQRGPLLVVLGLTCVLGTFSAAEFSSVAGLAIGVVVVAWAAGRLDVLRWAPACLAAAVFVMWPVVAHRLEGFGTATGVPVSWSSRWYNLTTYFWPDIFSGNNPLWGVRLSARVAVPTQGTGYVWIENGYTWLLWGGGLPLLLTYVAFVVVSVRMLLGRARALDDHASVAALAALGGVVVVAVLMVFDPHLTYRGSADLLFALLALAAVPRQSPRPSPPTQPASSHMKGLP